MPGFRRPGLLVGRRGEGGDCWPDSSACTRHLDQTQRNGNGNKHKWTLLCPKTRETPCSDSSSPPTFNVPSVARTTTGGVGKRVVSCNAESSCTHQNLRKEVFADGRACIRNENSEARYCIVAPTVTFGACGRFCAGCLLNSSPFSAHARIRRQRVTRKTVHMNHTSVVNICDSGVLTFPPTYGAWFKGSLMYSFVRDSFLPSGGRS